MNELPQPLTPPDCDLRNFREMPIDVPRLIGSDLVHDESPESCWSAVLLWCVAWHEVPAGSLPDNDEWLAKRAGYWHKGKLDETWHDVRAGALHGWIKCADGRLYHPVVAEKVNNAWHAKHRHAHGKLVERLRKRNRARTEKGLFPLEIPELEHWIDMGFPLERELFPEEFGVASGGIVKTSSGIPPENSLKGKEQNGEEQNGIERKPKTIGSNNGVGTPPANDEKSILAAVGVSSNLIAWERERGKFPKGLNASAQQVIDLAGLNVTAVELRAAYDDAVAERDKASDPGPVNAGFVRSFVEKHRRPPPKPKAPPLHTLNDAQLTQVGRECGAGEARVGESRDSYIDRIKRKQAENSRGAAA